MKNLARLVPVAAVLGTALFLSGCATSSTARVTRRQPVAEFTVVESSTKKDLTQEQMDELRDAVANYLHEQGVADNRVYYVKVTFPGDTPEDAAEWAIVRIGGVSARTYTILGAYPGPDDYSPYDYYGYNAGFDGFARYGYYDPFDYNYGYRTRPVPPRTRDHDRPDDRPGDKPDHPRTSPTGWDNHKHPDPDQPRRDNPHNPPTTPPRTRDHDRPDNPTPRTWTHDRSDDGRRDNGRRDDGGKRDWGRDRTSGGTASPNYRPPDPVRSDPPPRSEPSRPAQNPRDRTDQPTNER